MSNFSENISARILYEDNHLFIVNKICGEIVQGDKTGDQPLLETVRNYLKRKYSKPGNVFLGLPHRLDRPTSGVVIFAKTGKALARMSELFRNGELQKTYWAVVKSKPPSDSGTLEQYLLKNEKQNKSYVVEKSRKGAKKASLSYKLLSASKTYFLLEIELHTGRHHQIRCQLAHLGCPIKGDLKYGFPRSNEGGGIDLHSRSVVFVHPVKNEEIFVEAPPPGGIWDNFQTTR